MIRKKKGKIASFKKNVYFCTCEEDIIVIRRISSFIFFLVLNVGEKTLTTNHVNTLYTKVKFYPLERKSHETEVEEAKNLFN